MKTSMKMKKLNKLK